MLRHKLKNIRLILASGSPRRQQFFRELDVDFEIRLKEVEEVYPPELQAEEITNYLAKLKAKAFEDDLQKGDLVVTSDTIVWHNGLCLGKPKSKKEAIEMLQSLSGATHEVITSICFKTMDSTEVVFEKTKVSFEPLSDEAIEYYVTTYQPYDKAGGYAIQEWIGYIGIRSIEGSYTNVVGMPMHLVYQKLMSL